MTIDELVATLQSLVANLLAVPAAQIDPDLSLDTFGVDSATAVGLSGEVERLLNREVDPSLFLEHRSLRLAARSLLATNARDGHKA